MLPLRLTLVIALALVFGAFGVASPLMAERCDLGVEPAATLLLPYFEVDPTDTSGATTLLSVSNALSSPALANVTFWTDWGVPTFNFPIYLTGYDVVTMNIGLILREGFLPITADDVNDPGDTLSPSPLDAWEGDFENCESYFPFQVPGQPLFSEALIQRFQALHSGQPDIFGSDNECSGEDHGDGLLRGYVTIDTVNRCDLVYPSEAGYFADRGTGIASNVNQLFGDFYLIDPANAYAQGDSLVHIQAFDGVGEGGAWQSGDVTFYSRYVDYGAVDNREPLPSVFGARYLGDFGGTGGTDLIVWRDTYSTQASPLPCGERPDWWPLVETEALDFDEQENYVSACSAWFLTTLPEKQSSVARGSGTSEKLTPPPLPEDFACFQLASQRLGVAGDNQDISNIGFHDAGWLYLDFRQRPDSPVGQAWVIGMLSNDGQYSVGLPAASLYSACDAELPPDPFQ